MGSYNGDLTAATSGHATTTSGYAATAVAELAGQNVRLQPLTPADFEEYRELVTRNLEVLQQFGLAESAQDKIASQDAFEVAWRHDEGERERGSVMRFGVYEGEKLIGEIALEGLQWGNIRSASLSAWLDRDKLGGERVQEASVVLARHAFEDLGLHRIQFTVDVDNAPVRRALEKAGIREEGVLKNYMEINGEWRDNVRYAITKEEFTQHQDKLMQFVS